MFTLAETFSFFFNQKSSLLLIFFVNGSLLAALLLQRWVHQQNRPAKWLGAFLGLCVLYIALFMLGYAGWYADPGTRNLLFYLPMQQLLLIGPVIYFYTQSLLDESFELSKRNYLHFLPALIYNLAMLGVYINDQLILSDYFFYEDGKDMDLDPWYQWLGLFSMAFYALKSILHYNRYQQAAYDTLSFAEELLYKWIRLFLLLFLGILFLRVLFFILNPEWWEFGNKFWYYLSFSVLFNFIGFRGYIHAVQSETSSFLHSAGTVTLIRSSMNEDTADQSGRDSSNEELSVWKIKLEEYMNTEKSYENPQLTLADIADALDTNTRMISSIVNSQFDMNFNDWVNKYRTEAVIEQFKNGKHKQHTLLSIALDSGFNSKSTFNRAFKKHTGKTPARFLEELS